MADKVFCDPVHRHISFDKTADSLLLKLIGCPEVQRLRRIRQLGVSSYTYPGAVHTRFSHALGACHLMSQALAALGRNQRISIPEEVHLAARCAAMLHDVGHGPFSHLTERATSLKHERMTRDLILGDTALHKTLKSHSRRFPDLVASLLGATKPRWQFISDLLSSQVDVDRMDYLLRDAYFCGVPFGVYDHLRILHTMRVRKFKFDNRRHPLWLMKGRHAIEEFLYARYYMYWTVYYHKTTRCFEELYRAILARAKLLQEDGAPGMEIIPWVRELLAGAVRIPSFLALDDNVMTAQVSLWRTCCDRTLARLCGCFLDRRGFKPLGPEREGETPQKFEALARARGYLERKGLPPDSFLLYSKSVATAYDYYHPEKEEKTAKTSIVLADEQDRPQEISEVLRGVDALRKEDKWEAYYYVPREHERKLRPILAPLL